MPNIAGERHAWTREHDALILGKVGTWTFVRMGQEIGGLSKNHIRGRYLRLDAWRKEYKIAHPEVPDTQLNTALLNQLHPEVPTAGKDMEEDITIDHRKDSQSVSAKLVEAETQDGALEETLKKAKVDLAVWEVERWRAKKYQGFYRSRSYQVPGEKNSWRRKAKVVEMWSVDVSLVRRKPSEKENLNSLRDAVLAEIKLASPVIPPILYPHISDASETYMYEIDIPDLHNGKLCWAPETGDNYDSRISRNLFNSAVGHLMGSVRHLRLEQIQLPLGHDFFHVDNHTNTTTGGTPQDTDNRWFKTVRSMREAVVHNILQLRQVAPVHVVIVPGNHDQTRMLTFGEILAGWLHNCSDVTIDNSPKLRKYSRFGVNLIGHTHGNEEKPKDLPLIMAAEAGKDWAECSCCEWHTGHLHIRRTREFLTTDTHTKVVLRTLPSLSGTDAWHHKKGYIGSPRAAEAYLYGKKTGYAGHYTFNYRPALAAVA